MAGVYDVGRDFDAEEFATTLKNAGAEYVNVFARCCQGFAYYPTKFGTVHPGLKIDLFGQMVSACHKHDIKVVAYFNAGSDQEHVLRHREWCKVDKDGYVHNYQKKGHFHRFPCLNTPYKDYTLAMIGEVLDKYPVDGVFLDYFHVNPCYGVECLDGMKKMGLDPFNELQAKDYCRIITDQFLDDVTSLVREKAGDINICYNCIPYRKQPTHIEIEFLANGGWGYDFLPGMIRYARTLDKPFLTMTGRFHESWGDFGGLRREHSLLFDCYNSISNGGTCCIGDHLHPRGKLESAVFDLVGKIYNRLENLDPWTQEAKSVAEMVVVEPALRLWPDLYFDQFGHPLTGLYGVSRMLMELKYQFDISDGEGDLSKYKIIFLPDNIQIDENLAGKLKQHLQKGGVLISSAFSGMNSDKTAFSLEEYEIDYQGVEPFNQSFFTAEKEVSDGLVNMPITIYNPGIAMQGKNGARILARLYQPYFNMNSWDGYHENLYIPPEKDSGRPALVRMGNVFHFSFPVFTGYFDHAVIEYKTLVKNCIAQVFPKPLIKVENLPSFGQLTVTAQNARRMVHLLTYVPELRGKQINVIEEPIDVRNVQLALRTDGQKVQKVYLAPSRAALEFTVEDDYIKVVVPEINGYQMVVFE
jgi:hypothetical protein